MMKVERMQKREKTKRKVMIMVVENEKRKKEQTYELEKQNKKAISEENYASGLSENKQLLGNHFVIS